MRSEMLLYVMFSLGINAHACETALEGIPTVGRMNAFVVKHSKGLGRELDLTTLENQKLLAKNIFVIGQCVRGLQFHGLFGAMFSLEREGLYPGVTRMLGCMLRNEANHIEFFGNLLMELLGENPALKTAEFYAELAGVMSEAVTLEKAFIVENLPGDVAGVNADELAAYVDHIAECRLRCCGLSPLKPGVQNPLPWLDSMIHLRSTPETQLRATTLQQNFSDDEL
jgi:ribonucleoside-diphosphate reductase beta chain